MFGAKKKEPHDVFTPRSPTINESMYVPRPDLEQALKNALRGGLHVIVHGESGSGKSWLYKKVLKDMGATVETANLANASRLKSVMGELENVLGRQGKATKTGYAESKSAELSAGFASGTLDHTGEYSIGQKEPLEACFENVRSRAGSNIACVVLDNLESIFSMPEIMKELADIIVLLDDERYARHNVKLLIVGVPAGVKEYFSKTPNMATVANRLYETPEVSRLTSDQASELIRRGFVDELKFAVQGSDLQTIVDHARWVTDRVPQRIHEYCLELALLGEPKNSLSLDLLPAADNAWLGNSLSADYAVVQGFLNARETKVGRKNQCLFALGKITTDEFKVADLESMIRQEFPNSTSGIGNLNTNPILGEFMKSDLPLVKRAPKGDSYMFTDPKYRMCIRSMLTKTESESVAKVELRAISERSKQSL